MTDPPAFRLVRGDSRLVISVPHAGTFIPHDIGARLNATGRALLDTDWFVDRLYEFAPLAGATLLVATHSRTVVDLNRGPDGIKLYPGQAETGICPTESFDGAPLYDGPGPDAAEVQARVATYWQPYHYALQAELNRLRGLHQNVHLLDGHSIRGQIPRLFAGRLPDLNFGTNSDHAASTLLVETAMAATAPFGFSQVLNGRFRGGFITRHYGRPAEGVQAIQLEMAWEAYMGTGAGRLLSALLALVNALSK
jgi:N-formylglutamate deformylase